MRTIRIESSYRAWRERARALLRQGVRPETILWEDERAGTDSLFQSPADQAKDGEAEDSKPSESLRVPAAFLKLAERVACHRDPSRWALLYRVLWRVAREGDRHLLEIATDVDVEKPREWEAQVRRDQHKMKAFVRFRAVGESERERDQFVAWFEPDHFIVESTAPFFVKRFAGMDWS